jgi:hypothetical protein
VSADVVIIFICPGCWLSSSLAIPMASTNFDRFYVVRLALQTEI